MILVVDDDPNILEIITDALVDEGYTETYYTTHPSSVLAEVEKGEIKLCILDIGMKELNGYDLMVILKREFPAIKIITVSGYADLFEDKLKALSIDGILSKPFSNQDLLSLVDHALGRKKRRPAKKLDLRAQRRVQLTSKSPVRMDIMGDGFVEIVQVIDLGPSGAKIYAPHQFVGCDINSEIQVIITFPGKQPFQVKGKIKHFTGEDKKTFGVEFINLSGADKKQIEAFINKYHK
jgi:CheY-like chemotaxis protein